jgi:F-type H+-transporting ATPase subunit a
MDGLHFTPDSNIWWQWGVVKLNATIVYTWVVMAVLVGFSILATRRLTSGPRMSRWQNLLEVVVGFLRREIRQLGNQDPDPYVPFVGTLFLFIFTANLLDVVPGMQAPTASLSTTAALAACVFFAVPIFGIARDGLWAYLKNYVRPSPLMLPFNIIGELSRTLALAVRLFGNVMSGSKVAAILLMLVPVGASLVMNAIGLLTGTIQAYIFAALAMVYIASGMQARQRTEDRGAGEQE